MKIELREIRYPIEDIPLAEVTIPHEEFQLRIQQLYATAGMDWMLVYADREHTANLTFLTGYDPRFEEALLVIGAHGRACLIVGNEGKGYVPITTPWIETRICQSFSLAGQPRDQWPRLSKVLQDIGIEPGQSIGMVGWKYLEAEETDDVTEPAYIPAFIVELTRRLVGKTGKIVDVTPLMMHPVSGMRTHNTASQIAFFERSAMRASACLFRIVQGVRPGMNGYEAAALMRYEGDPLSAHVMFASGKANIVGLCSPGSTIVEKGDGVTTAVSFWGSLACRAGMVTDSLDSHFFEVYCVPYYRAIATWYQSLRIGMMGGDLFTAVAEAFGQAPFHSMLNPGHLVSYDEWVHSPIRPGSVERIDSGMALQSDIIPYPLPSGVALNCEDTLVIANPTLRQELETTYPSVWERIIARRRFMRDELGIQLAEEVLPLSTAPAYLPPFWLMHNMVCAIR